jgi:hypothetical protein
MTGYESVSRADLSVDRETLWAALTDAATLGEAMFGTRLTLTQDDNPTEAAADHSRENWNAMLDRLKKLVEP